MAAMTTADRQRRYRERAMKGPGGTSLTRVQRWQASLTNRVVFKNGLSFSGPFQRQRSLADCPVISLRRRTLVLVRRQARRVSRVTGSS
jgi:hypothetical protein